MAKSRPNIAFSTQRNREEWSRSSQTQSNTNHWYLWSDGQLMARPHPRSSGHITKGGNQAERGNARCSSWGRESVEDQKLRLSLPTCWKLHFLALSHAYRPVMSPPCVHSGALQVSHSEWPYLTYSDFHSMEKNTMEVNGYQQLFGYQHSSKYLLLCSAE